jgi:hypothetical protein
LSTKYLFLAALLGRTLSDAQTLAGTSATAVGCVFQPNTNCTAADFDEDAAMRSTYHWDESCVRHLHRRGAAVGLPAVRAQQVPGVGPTVRALLHDLLPELGRGHGQHFSRWSSAATSLGPTSGCPPSPPQREAAEDHFSDHRRARTRAVRYGDKASSSPHTTASS